MNKPEITARNEIERSVKRQTVINPSESYWDNLGDGLPNHFRLVGSPLVDNVVDLEETRAFHAELSSRPQEQAENELTEVTWIS